LTELKLLTCLH